MKHSCQDSFLVCNSPREVPGPGVLYGALQSLQDSQPGLFLGAIRDLQIAQDDSLQPLQVPHDEDAESGGTNAP